MSKETGREWEHKKYSLNATFEKHDFFGYFDAYPDILAEISIYEMDESCYSIEVHLRDFKILRDGMIAGLEDAVERHILEDDYRWFIGRHAKDEAHEYALEVMSAYAKRFGDLDLNLDELLDEE